MIEVKGCVVCAWRIADEEQTDKSKEASDFGPLKRKTDKQRHEERKTRSI